MVTQSGAFIQRTFIRPYLCFEPAPDERGTGTLLLFSCSEIRRCITENKLITVLQIMLSKLNILIGF